MKTSNTAERLQAIMRERKLKQVDILKLSEPFCKEYGVQLKKNDLSQYVNGKSSPGQFKLTILSRALNVNEAWLMGYDVSSRNLESEGTKGNVHLSNTLTDPDKIIELYYSLDEIDRSEVKNFIQYKMTSKKYHS